MLGGDPVGQPPIALQRVAAPDLLEFLMPHFQREGKAYLTVAVGCTGGKHRSVAIARALQSRFEGRAGVMTQILDRDVDKE